MRLLQLVIVFLLFGCGGNGGSSDTGSGSGGGSGDNQALTINADNALHIAAATNLSNDTLTSLAQLAVLAHDELNNKPRILDVAKPVFCRNSPDASELVVHTIPDTYYLGANQRFSIVFKQCQMDELEAEVNGELDILIRSVALNGYSLEISSADYLLNSRNLSLKDEDGIVEIEAEINSRYSAENKRYSYTITPAGSNLVLTLPDTKREQFHSFNTKLVLDNLTGRYQLSTSGTLQSDILGGSVSVATIAPLSGQLQRLPNSGELRFQASGNSIMRLTSIVGTEGLVANINLPELALEGQIDWLELSTGASWQKTGSSKNFSWREQRDFVNLEAEWLEPGQNMMLKLLPEQPITLHFSNIVTELGGYGSRLVLSAVDDQGFSISGVPEIDVEIDIWGTTVQLIPASPLLAGYRYWLGSAFAKNNSSTIASVPVMYVTLVEELSATIDLDSNLFSSGETVEVYPDIKSDLGPASTTWQTDDTVAEKNYRDNQGLSIKLTSAPVGSYLDGVLSLIVTNARGNQVIVNQPYVIIDQELTDYFYNDMQALSSAGTPNTLLAPIDTNADIGNDTGIYTGVSGLTTDRKSWSLWLRSGDGGILYPGSYIAGDEEDLSQPHIEVVIDGRTCKTQQASFTVHQAAYEAESPFVTKLSADYELICLYNQLSYRYRGKIRFQRSF